MKKILFTALSILISCVSFSQQINISITDSLTKEDLPFATVYLKNTGIGTTSNFEGKALLKIKTKNSDSDTLICSYIGYQTKTLQVDLSKSINLNILLSQSSTNLSEFVITYKKPLTSKQILKKSIKNTSKNYSNIPVNLKGLYRETLKESDKYIYLNEAVVDIHYTKYIQNSIDKKTYQKWQYDDEYAFEYKPTWFNGFPANQFNTRDDKVRIIESRSSESSSLNNFDMPITGNPLSLTARDYVKYRYDFFNPNTFNNYIYTIKKSELINTKHCYVIQFHPKPSSKRVRFNHILKNKNGIYTGRIYIEKSSFAVVKMDFQLLQNFDYGFFQPIIPLDHRVSIEYEEYESKWYIKKVNFQQTRRTLGTSYQELFVTHINKDSVYQISDNEEWKHTRLTTLRNREAPYNIEFWEAYEKTDYPTLSKKIKHDLETKTPLEKQFNQRFKQKENLPIPKTKKVDFVFDYPTERLTDNYQWFADTTKQTELHRYLEKENEFADNYLISNKNYQRDYFNALNNFYPKDTSTINKRYNKGNLIYDEDSLENTILYEYTDSINRTPIFNLTEFKDSRKNCFVTSIKSYHNSIGITYTDNGGLSNNLILQTKGTTVILDSIYNVYSYEWFNDSNLLYTKSNKLKRSDKLFQRNLIHKKDSLLLFESDLTYDISLSKTKNYIVSKIESKDESEIYLIKKEAENPSLQLLKERQVGITYAIKEFDNHIYMITNKDAVNNKLLLLTDNKSWKEVIPHSKDVLITDFIVTENYFVLETYKDSYLEIKYKRKNESKWEEIDFKNKIFNASIQLIKDDKVKIYYSNPRTPHTQFEFDLTNAALTKRKATKIKRGINPQYYKTERLWAKSKDGVKIPITLTKSLSPKKKHKGLILKAYGAYGNYPLGNTFSAEDAILLNDGFTIAYAHIRGSIAMGNQWYLDGKLLNKENSFDDYISCAEYLIKKKITTPDHLIGYGNSAGGLIMGVVINRRPELFNTIVLDHPYLDVLTTMMNDSLPLTTDEYKEWGNPSEKEVYKYIKSYSPYQNIKKQEYPNLLFIASSNDFQTPVWQIAKYVAKLKEFNTGNNSILFKTDIGSGHIGNTSGKEWIKNLSFQYAYIYGNIFK
jgi:protease II